MICKGSCLVLVEYQRNFVLNTVVFSKSVTCKKNKYLILLMCKTIKEEYKLKSKLKYTNSIKLLIIVTKNIHILPKFISTLGGV